ncbi:MAG TPA: 2-dehydropantoate 2-reductase [Xanthobacteraceae bacterium]|nr:2-dehydropantoate 2-reductase [Xanthobacteraceae bacterium]
MRILVVGAGAIGGYFGGRLLEAGRDVTFLVRARRGAQLAKTGLVIRSKFGDASLPAPPTVMADALRAPYDLILLSCKAYDLESAADSFAPAVGANTAILPLLNGMAHMDFLAKRFGGGAVLGGQCVISTTLDADGGILHLNDTHGLSFGEPHGSTSARAEAVRKTFSGARFDSRLSDAILQEMWEKWVFIAATAGMTCLMRATVGDIIAAGAANLTSALLDECAAIAAADGFAPREASHTRSRTMLTAPGSTFAASMLRDIEHGAPIEADHIVGDLIRRGEHASNEFPLLRIAYAHLKAYEARRARENAVSKAA